MQKVSEKNGILFCDESNVFCEEKDFIYFDIVHFSDKGNKLMAKKMFDMITMSSFQ